jgi:UDP-N-acetylglucosamine 2-epimerase (non-hydrolysing)
MKRIAVVFGTRPEAIKLVPVIRAFRQLSGVELKVVVTAQHREMLDQVLRAFSVTPDIDLNLMRPNQSLAGLTSQVLQELDSVYESEKPHLVLVQGDTTTTFCASLAAFYRNIPLGHVEAGLRTHNFSAPWPEEANRVLTTQLADLHFAPTDQSRLNLLAEGIAPETIFITGNTAIDTLLLACDTISKNPVEVPGLPEALLHGEKIVLITGHRRENFGSGFEAICRAIAALARTHPGVHFVYPVHLNPNVLRPVTGLLGDGRYANVYLIRPLGYLPFVRLMQASSLILTDSGGIQEEAPSLAKPVLVMRDTTERPEALSSGACRLVGTDSGRIVSEVSQALKKRKSGQRVLPCPNPFGDGKAAERISRACMTYLTSGPQN